MEPERWHQIERLYHAAREREPRQRDRFLQDACGGDEELRHELESLLGHEPQAESFLEASALEVTAKALAKDRVQSMIGRTLGHYQIVSLLGAGGMGEVYRAKDTRLQREVAVKILPPHLATDAAMAARFEREAKAIAALSHPNILAIHDFGTEEGVSYAVMELLEGENLRARLERSALDWRQAVEMAMAIADGLSAAHAKGITHRDLKPENIFLSSDGRVRILDFSLAQVRPMLLGEEASAAIGAPSLTELGMLIGTVGYMSPEQTEGKKVDARSDIFSFGAVLYEMVTGRRAFRGHSKISTLAAILHLEPQPVKETVAGVPRKLERLILRCLRKDPGQRFQNVDDLNVALHELGEHSGFIAGPRPSVAALILAGIFLILATASVAWWLQRSPSWSHMLSELRRASDRIMPSAINRGRSATRPCLPPPAGLVGWWPADDSAGDIIGSNVSMGSSTGLKFAPGMVGRAFDFDRAGGHVDAGDSAALAPAAITVEFWMNIRSARPDLTHPAARWGHIYSRSLNSWIFTYTPGHTIFFSVQTEASRNEGGAGSVSTIPLNQWHHVAGTFDPIEGKIRAYLDGRLEMEKAHRGAMLANASITSIGCKFAEETCMFPFDGLIDEFSIYNRALSPSEIQAIFSAGSAGKCKPRN